MRNADATPSPPSPPPRSMDDDAESQKQRRKAKKLKYAALKQKNLSHLIRMRVKCLKKEDKNGEKLILID